MATLVAQLKFWFRCNPIKTISVLAAGGLLAAILLILAWHYHVPLLAGIATLREFTISHLQSVSPVVFFIAMAVLPALLFPLSVFYLTASTVMGSPLAGVLVACVAVSTNIALSYWLATGVLHPLAERLVRRFGYSIPKLRPEIEWKVIALVRLSPMPFPLQNYLLGLAKARFWPYWWISSLIQCGWAIGVVLLADSLFSGTWHYAVLGAGVLLLVIVGMKYLRKRTQKQKGTNLDATILPAELIEKTDPT